MSKKEQPFGTWVTPITAEMTTRIEKGNRNCDIVVNGSGIFWTEPRPAEKGRTIIKRMDSTGAVKILTPPIFDVRSKVHEYGGLSYAVLNDKVFFVNAVDQRLYTQEIHGSPMPLTKSGTRFADLLPTPHGIVAVAEVHENNQTDNFLALIDPATGHYSLLHQGNDFYAFPALSPDGKKLAWLTWNHPNMPWDGTLLWTACFHEGKLKNKRMVAGGIEESIYQPQWSPFGHLYFISDRSGWWNIYRLKDHTIENVCPLEAEFGVPLWRLGTSTWRFTGTEEQILCTYQEKGKGKLALLDPNLKRLKPIDLPYTDYSQMTIWKDFAYFLAGSPTVPRQLIKMDLKTLALSIIDPEKPLPVDPAYFSCPLPIQFPSVNGRTAYGYFYAPENKDYKGKGLPPLIIMSHGGPTGAADPIFNLRIQYWTSRGFAVLDVNYGGSVGYGRNFRESLKGSWGIIDVEDCIQGATFLAHQKKVDPKKIVIRGGSAGGFTTLEALAQAKIFTAGAVYYGVSDLESLVSDTHKFEKDYLERLIGPYPERKDLYYERSPLHHADKISCPVIFFQGGKDKVVPPNQSEKLYNVIKKRKIKTELVLYPEEEHGLRQAENIRDSLEKELKFYLEAFGEL